MNFLNLKSKKIGNTQYKLSGVTEKQMQQAIKTKDVLLAFTKEEIKTTEFAQAIIELLGSEYFKDIRIIQKDRSIKEYHTCPPADYFEDILSRYFKDDTNFVISWKFLEFK